MIIIVMSYAMLEKIEGCLGCKIYKSLSSSCVRKPWKMMDRPRDCIAEKGILSLEGE
jgi:hypothetical protein